MFNRKKKERRLLETINMIKPTSKSALKQQCLYLARMDVEKAEKMYDFLIRDMEELKQFCAELPIDMAVLTLPKECAKEVSNQLVDYGIRGLWNFTGVELSPDNPSVVVENVHLGDSLMILNYKLCKRADDKKRK